MVSIITIKFITNERQQILINITEKFATHLEANTITALTTDKITSSHELGNQTRKKS